MMRVSVMADKSQLVNAIGTFLATEIGPDAFTYCWTRNTCEAAREHPSVMVRVDEGEPSIAAMMASLPTSVDGPLLVMGLSLSSRNLHVVECHQLDEISMERVINLVRDFCRTYPDIIGHAVGVMKHT